jgi:TP901 family phage tail tape measure protein
VARKNNIDVVVKGDYQDKDINRAIGDLKKLQASSMSLGGRMQALGGQVQAFGNSMARTGKSLTAGVTLPIVGIGIAATKMAVDFDTSLTKMVSLVGLTRDEVDGMRGDIISMASQYGKSASEAADAMFFITSAGLRGADAMETLEASLKGAAIGLGDVQTIADLSTSAMNAYGAANLSATEATSILRTAVEQGKLESSELASAMGSVLPISSALGVGFDEVAAAMAGMSRTGSNAATASTQLSGILSQITKETPKGTKALESVGLSYAGLQRQLREEGLLATLQTLVGAFDGNTVATSAFFGNIRALKGVMDMLGPGAQTTEEIFSALAATTAEDLNPAFDAASETTGFKLQQAFATLKNSLIEFGDIIAPFVEQFAARLKTLGDSFQNLSPQAKQFIVTGAAIAAAVGPLLIIFGKLIAMVGGVIKILGGITIAGSILAIKVVAVVAAIAGVVLAFKAMHDRSQALRDAVSRLIDTAKNIARVLVGDVISAFKSVTGAGGDVRSILDRVATVAGNILAGALRVLTSWWNILANGVRLAIKVFEVVFKIVRMVATLIRGAFVAAIDILMNKLGPVSKALRALANGVRNAFTQVVTIVRGAFTNIGKFLEGFINGAIGVVNALIDAYNALEGVIPGVTAVTRVATFSFKNLSGAAASTGKAVDHLGGSNAALGKHLAASARDSHSASLAYTDVGNSASGAVDGLDEFTEGLAGAGGGGGGGTAKASDKAAERMEAFKAKFTEVADSLKSKTKEIQDAYDGVISSVQGVVMGAFDVSNIDPNRVGENGEKVGGTWLDGLASQAEKAVNFANKVAEVVKLGLQPGSPAFETVMGVTKQQGEGLLDELIAGGVDAVNRSIAIVDSVTGAALRVGTDAAEQFYGTGLALAKQTEAAFTKRFGEGGPGYGKLNRMMSALAKSMERTTTITVVTKHVPEGIPGKRLGGPVAAGSPYIVGEAGPELFVPTMPGRIIPNHRMSDSMTGRSGAVSMGAAGGSVINLTVNAGMGTNGAEVGREIVDAIKRFERTNGPAFASA